MHPIPRLLLALLFCGLAPRASAHEVATEMVAAARQFLDALDAGQRKLATYALTDAERENWNFVPLARQGLPLQRMTAGQQALGLALLRTGLSHTGHAQAGAIMALELVLKEIENDRPPGRRDPTLYFVTIFGEPSAEKSWGWRFEGHHLSCNFTVVDGRHVFFAPSFMGTNPAVLSDELDLGLDLIASLDATQRQTAIIAAEALKEIVTTNQKRIDPLSPAGIPAARLTAAQREKLYALVKTYLRRYRPELAAENFAKIEAAGLDRICFAWAGALDRAKPTYYRLQGPTFLIEFDNFQNNANHIHSTVREFTSDFGRDLLAEHLAKAHGKD
ncbi:MAG: DUF3500 domain-containing protein [Verrucomicrobia bacterium]|nr:DUF3500 domain-containing protein [Verrucomicrobiota bacterium]